MHVRCRQVGITLLCGLCALGGCKQQTPERKYRAVPVTAVRIDVETGLVTVEWRDGSSAEVQTYDGRVTVETEIFINGISAGLEDVRVGDRGVVTVYPAGAGDTREWIVTRVSVNREESFIPAQPPPDTSSIDP